MKLSRRFKARFVKEWGFWAICIYPCLIATPILFIFSFGYDSFNKVLLRSISISYTVVILLGTYLYFRFRSELKKPIRGELYRQKDAYNLTPQQYIDLLNRAVSRQNDTRYWPVPPFAGSGWPIDIGGGAATLTLTANAQGLLTRLEWAWDAARKDAEKSVGLYLRATVSMLSPQHVDDVLEKLDMLDDACESYETHAQDGGSKFHYRASDNARTNTLAICPDRPNALSR